MAPRLILWIYSGSRKKEPRCTCLKEARDSHSQRMWAEVSSSTPHFLHNGLSVSPSMWRVLCPVRWPITALDWVLLKDINLALASQPGPEINSQACLWVLPRPRNLAQCWLINQRLSSGLLHCITTQESKGLLP